jgi:hypothetical protein
MHTLLGKSISGNLTFFNQQLHFCIPNVNKKDVADKILEASSQLMHHR